MNSSRVRRKPRKNHVANQIGDGPIFVELDSKSSTIGKQLAMKAPKCAFHNTGNDLTSKSAHQANAACSKSMATPCNSRVAIAKVRTFSLTCLMARACAIARTPKRSFNSQISASRIFTVFLTTMLRLEKKTSHVLMRLLLRKTSKPCNDGFHSKLCEGNWPRKSSFSLFASNSRL